MSVALGAHAPRVRGLRVPPALARSRGCPAVRSVVGQPSLVVFRSSLFRGLIGVGLSTPPLGPRVSGLAGAIHRAINEPLQQT